MPAAAPVDTAKLPPSLHFSDPAEPGIARKQVRGKWAYFTPDGDRIKDRDEIDRLNALALPPAYRDAWFCTDPHGHLQAIGYDEKGRKQYRYHAGFREAQDAAKYERTAEFGEALPKLRARVEHDLARRLLGRDTVAAAIVRLLDLGRVRVGNDAYAKANKSFGATTLRDRHATFSAGKLHLDYLGKSGKTQRITVEDKRLATIVKRCQDLPGQRLFQYVDGDGARHALGSGDVNDYIRETTGTDFTAKHFRTWGASVIAFETLLEAGDAACSLKSMLAPVAAALGNTPAIARKSYVHPALIELARQGACIGGLKLPRATQWLRPSERGLIGFLHEVAAAAAKDADKKAA